MIRGFLEVQIQNTLFEFQSNQWPTLQTLYDRIRNKGPISFMTRLNEKEIVNLFVNKLTNHSRIKNKYEINHIRHNYSAILSGNDDVSVIPFKKNSERAQTHFEM